MEVLKNKPPSNKIKLQAILSAISLSTINEAKLNEASEKSLGMVIFTLQVSKDNVKTMMFGRKWHMEE